MATTTNFSWETPDDTDLVKDGAAAIRTLGSSIDTSFVDLKGGTSGQLLSKASNTDLDYTWVDPSTGDITGVTAGTGISGGGTSGTVTVTNSMATAIDAKGDLIVGTAADTFSRLAVGTNNQVLVADSAEATGLKWATASAGALTKISSVSFSNVASQAFQSVFSGTYRSYIVEFSGLFKSGVGSATLQADFYSGTNTTYTDVIRGGFLQITTSGTSATGYSMTSGYVASFNDIPEDGYRRSGGNWNVSSGGSSGGFNVTGQFMGGGDNNRNYVGGFKSTNNTAITGFRLFASSGNIDGTVTIYGLEN